MKKFLAIVLSVLMVLSLNVIALADTCTASLDSGSCEIDCEVGSMEWAGHMLPGETYNLTMQDSDYTNKYIKGTTDGYKAAAGAVGIDGKKLAADTTFGLADVIGSDNWRVSTDWDIGGAMVEKVKWQDDDDDGAINPADTASLNAASAKDGNWTIVLNENYTIATAKRLKGTITFTSKKNKDIEFDVDVDEVVSNHLVTVDGYTKQSDAEDDAIDADDNTLYQCDEDNPGYISFNDGRLLSCTLKMVKNEKAFMYNDEDMVDELEDKYDDSDASIDCYTFGGSPVFTNDAQFKLQADYADQYHVYTWQSGKLTKQDYKWNSIDGVYEWSTKAPKTYVISDKELTAASETKDTSAADATKTGTKTKNPDTGANDVVGVAAALAVVSLVAAGAVSLKK